MKKQLARLIQLSKEDGEINDAELELIFDVADKNGIDRNELATLSTEEITNDEENHVKLFYQLLILASADGELSEIEEAHLLSMGDKFGLPSDKVAEALNHIKENGGTDLSDDQMIDVFSTN